MNNRLYMLESVEDTICNSFIITTESGKVISVDGGHRAQSEYLLNTMREITKSGKPHIDAWILTHPHADHIQALFDIVENYPDEIEIDRIYLNFPSQLCFEGSDEDGVESMELFYSALPKISDRLRILSGGDKLKIGEAEITVLYSQDFEIKGCNNSSLVFRVDLAGKSILFTGDCGEEAGNKILRLWKDSGILNCDIVTMSHHGQQGVSREFYEAVSPEICLWPTPSWLWTNCDGTGNFTTLETRKWIEELGVKENYIMKDGAHMIEL